MDTLDSPDPDRLFSFFLQLNRLRGALPFQRLSLPQRRELGGLLLPGGPGIVHAVSAALAARPDLSPDIGTSAEALLAEQRAAYRWLAILDCLQAMTRLAADSYTQAQAQATRRALGVLRAVQNGPPAAGPGLAGERSLPLVPAYLMIHAYYRDLEKKKAQRRRLRRAQAEAAAPPAPAAPPSPARLRAQRAERALRRAALQDLFATVLREIQARNFLTNNENSDQHFPAGRAPRAALDRPGKEVRMDEAEKRLFDLFAQKENLVEQEPAFAAAFTPPVEKLTEGRDQARALFDQGPRLDLSEAQRQDLAVGRFPELQGVLGLFSTAVARHPEIAADTEAQPPLWERMAALDRALGRLVWAGQLLARGGESGELLTAAAAQGLCQTAMSRASARRTDPALTEDQRNGVASLFAEPARIEKERRDREAQSRAAADKSLGEARARLSQAQEAAAMARVIEAFLDATRRSS